MEITSGNGKLSDVRKQVGGRSFGSSLTFLLLLCYVAAIPLKFQIRWLLVYIQLALFLAIVLRVVLGLKTISFTRTQLVAFVILFSTVCATLFGHLVVRRGENLDQLPQITRFVVFALGCILELESRRRVNQFLTVAMYTAAIVSLLSIVNLVFPLPFGYTGQPRSFGPLSFGISRSLGVWMSFGSFGILAVIGAAFAGLRVFRPVLVHGPEVTSYMRLFSAVAMVLILAGVILGQSRSTILAFLLAIIWGLAVATFHTDTRLRASTPKLTGGVLFSGAISAGIKAPAVLNSFFGTNSASVAVRVEQYRFALELMSRRPVFGWGWGYFETAFGASYTVHNLWFLVGVSLGVPVFLLWIYFFAILGLEMFRGSIASDGRNQGYSFIGVTIIIGGTVEMALYPGFTPATAVLIGVLLGIQGLGSAASHCSDSGKSTD